MTSLLPSWWRHMTQFNLIWLNLHLSTILPYIYIYISIRITFARFFKYHNVWKSRNLRSIGRTDIETKKWINKSYIAKSRQKWRHNDVIIHFVTVRYKRAGYLGQGGGYAFVGVGHALIKNKISRFAEKWPKSCKKNEMDYWKWSIMTQWGHTGCPEVILIDTINVGKSLKGLQGGCENFQFWAYTSRTVRENL